ncbi:helix-turn-helix domain-containing protein [Salinivibrio socompensis]|uniref:helix-turn-helix domain-containing protein n=1 Tax=Salinivibrio socompensis TaxID=1510206 RepID=UPI0004B09E6F|nr:helix-turn-helix transcriptional regulator [Salinivibrio socompensis]
MIDAIRVIRKRKGLSQAELAALAGMSEGTYQKYESGAVDIKLKRYHQIIDALGVSELDVVLERLDISGAGALDVAAAARLLEPQSRLEVVQTIVRE